MNSQQTGLRIFLPRLGLIFEVSKGFFSGCMNRRRLKRLQPSENWILGRPASFTVISDLDA